MSWVEERAKFQKRFDNLAQENVQGLITELNKAVGNYISKGGLSQDPNNNAIYENIQKLTKRAEAIKQQYAQLNDDIINYIRSQTADNDMTKLLTENGELQKQINRLEKIQEEMKVDVESAIARDELLRSRSTDITRHKLFILDRPVKRGLIPYLWAIAILFIGVGLVIFKMTAPNLGLGATVANGVQPSMFDLIIEFVTNKVVLSSLLISALIVIIFLSLKIAGVFGK
jgi:archaellum component FlaC